MTRTGNCACGAVTLEASADPISTFACWCSDCQKLTTGGAAHDAFFRSEDVSWTGPVKWHEVMPASGTPLARGFCAECGTPILARSTADRPFVVVRIGIFGDTSGLAPQQTIWTGSAPPWAHIDPAIPSREN
jgi:hypothetical protein